jgi:hypothetical protein
MTLEAAVRALVTCAARDGNLLLNVGPSATGVIEPREGDLLRAIGSWLDAYGECIRGTRGVPADDGAALATSTLHAVYIHVFEWPERPIGLGFKIDDGAGVEVLTGGAAHIERADDGRALLLWDSGDHDPIDTIVRISR